MTKNAILKSNLVEDIGDIYVLDEQVNQSSREVTITL